MTEAQKKYKQQQKKLRQKGRAERKKRTHQLITIGMAWQHFLKQHNLASFSAPETFENLLCKLSSDNDNILMVFIYNDLFYLGVTNNNDLKYRGSEKSYIHYLCTIGGMWESFYKNLCRNNPREKNINENIICRNDKCKKIQENHDKCYKLDLIFFYSFIDTYKYQIKKILSQC